MMNKSAARPGFAGWTRRHRSGKVEPENPVPDRQKPAGAVEMPFPRASQALSRFTVLDLTRVRSGPTCVRQLGDWGANVIKIDALMEGAAGEQPGGPRHGSDFQNLHRNKRAMTLNLKDPRGLEVFRRLVEKADVVVENFRPDVKARLGTDYDALGKIKPGNVQGRSE